MAGKQRRRRSEGLREEVQGGVSWIMHSRKGRRQGEVKGGVEQVAEK